MCVSTHHLHHHHRPPPSQQTSEEDGLKDPSAGTFIHPSHLHPSTEEEEEESPVCPASEQDVASAALLSVVGTLVDFDPTVLT